MQSNLTCLPISFQNIGDLRKIHSFSEVTHEIRYEYNCMNIWKDYSWIAYIEDIPVGSVVSREEKWNEYLSINILDFDVVPDYQRHKIGSRMMETLKERALAKDTITSIILHVWINNDRAINFYRSQGFKIVDWIENYYWNSDPQTAYICEYMI